jgi:hypothetical protein
MGGVIIPKRYIKSGKPNKSDYQWGNPNVYGVIIARVLAAFSMFWFPWWGFFVSLFLDFIDSWFWMQKAGYNRKMYNNLDKWMDWICYAVEYYFVLRSGYWLILTLLLIWRFVGQLIFAKKRETKYFLYTPNFYEVFYMWLIAAPLEHITDGMAPVWYWSWFAALLGFKIIQELWLHAFWPWYLHNFGFPQIAKFFGYHNVGYHSTN